MKFQTLAVTVGVSVASGLVVYYLTRPRNPALPTCERGSGGTPRSAPLTRSFTGSKALGTLSSAETEMAQCPLGPTCSLGGVCACTFCGPRTNGIQNTKTEKSGALQSWGARLFSCGRTSCYAAAVKRSTSCVTQVVSTQGAAGTCGWGKCNDFSSCC